MNESQMFPSYKSLLSRPRILAFLATGDIRIDPYDKRNVGTSQYDVTLGVNFYRVIPAEGRDLPMVASVLPVYNPFDEKVVMDSWKLHKAKHHSIIMEKSQWDKPLANIGLMERVIMIRPGETILAHTNEFIGGASRHITTMLKARSSTGRNFLEVCKCAGMGDIGYCNRWTMEITNNSEEYVLPLVVGRRIGQIVFFETTPLDPGDDDYSTVGKYQTTGDFEAMKAAWTPEAMLPKQWRDREVRELNG